MQANSFKENKLRNSLIFGSLDIRFFNTITTVMKLLYLSIAVLLLSAGLLQAEALESRYASQGTLFITHFASAPFPHPDRAKGHYYHQEFFSEATNYSDSSVGIFVPKGFRTGAQTDFIIHFHGWRNHVESVMTNFNLVEQFCQSGRNAIFIVPQGPRDAADSFGGKLEDAGGFQRFMAEAVRNLRERGIIRSTNIGNIILSGHSGGYHVMSGIVARGGVRENIREVWLFDALYDKTPEFAAWFAGAEAHRVIDIYTLHGGTKEESEKWMESLKAVPAKTPFLNKKEVDFSELDLRGNHLLFIDSALEHNQVIFKHDEFRKYLETSVLKPIEQIRSPKDAAAADISRSRF